MNPQTEIAEYPYVLRIETTTGHSISVPIAFLTAKQVEVFLQSDFTRLVQEAGLSGVRIHVERAPTADYDKVLGEVATYLRTATPPRPSPRQASL